MSSIDSAAAESDIQNGRGLAVLANGGFPEPPPGGVVRVVRAEHQTCGHGTRVRLPAHVSPQVVRRVVCHECAEAFETPAVEEVEVLEPDVEDAPRRTVVAELIPAPDPPAPRAGSRMRLPRVPRLPSAPSLPSLPSFSFPEWLRDPSSRVWRLASIPVAAIAVIGGLLLIQGGSEESKTPFAGAAPTVAEDQPGGGNGGAAKESGSASLVRESSFSMALPAGWERTSASGGATFSAAADAGDADATLWVERDPDLSFGDFEARSLDTLEALAGSARVVERVAAPTPEDTVVRLAADNPPGSPVYEVTLRAAGPYRYYLATTVQPDASQRAVEGAELVHGSFQPIAGGGK